METLIEKNRGFGLFFVDREFVSLYAKLTAFKIKVKTMQDKLTDPCDIAELEIQRELDRAINVHNNKKRMEEKGSCYDCGSDIESGLFCDKDCRDEYEWYQQKKGK